jgi:hypothetical protein
MGQTVVQSVDQPLQRDNPFMLGSDQTRPAWKPPGQLINPVSLCTGFKHLGVFSGRRLQRIKQCRIRTFRQAGRFNVQRARQIVQQFATDAAFVMLDQVQVTGGNSDRLGQMSLPQPKGSPAIPDPAARQGGGAQSNWTHHHLTAPSSTVLQMFTGKTRQSNNLRSD